MSGWVRAKNVHVTPHHISIMRLVELCQPLITGNLHVQEWVTSNYECFSVFVYSLTRTCGKLQDWKKHKVTWAAVSVFTFLEDKQISNYLDEWSKVLKNTLYFFCFGMFIYFYHPNAMTNQSYINNSCYRHHENRFTQNTIKD